jgi:vacuolar-type H+-ATPase subunit E/Vma4
MLRKFATLVATLLLVGCATIRDNPVPALVGIQSATLYVIEQSSDRKAKARDIIAAAEDAKKLLDFEAVTLDQLVARVRERIANSDRELSEKAGLSGLLTIAQTWLQDRISEVTLSPDDKATVNDVLSTIIQSAQAYAG